MPAEQIIVAIGGAAYSGWKRIEVRAAFHEACRSFSLTVAAEAGPTGTNAIFREGTPIQIMAGGDLMLDGYVNCRRPRFSAKETSLTVTGRTKGQDHVDCSAMHPTGYFENMDPVAIANAVGPASGLYYSDRQLEPLDYYQMTPGENVHDMVDDMCRDQGMTCCGQPDGRILVTDASQSQRHAGQLLEGWNMEEAEGEFSDENRHSETHVRGQHPRGHGASNLQQHAMAPDSGVTRHRPHVHHHHGKATPAQIAKRAADRRNRKAGNAVRASITAPTWRDDGGMLWTPGYRVFTMSPFLDLAQDMLVEGVNWTAVASGEGTRSSLDLVDPQAYGGQAGKGGQSGGSWSFDASGAS